MSVLRWTNQSTQSIAEELTRQGHPVSDKTVARCLLDMGYSLQLNRKTKEGRQHPNRDAQSRYINRQEAMFRGSGDPVISVDTKKKELVGTFQNKGRTAIVPGYEDLVFHLREEAVQFVNPTTVDQVRDFPEPPHGLGLVHLLDQYKAQLGRSPVQIREANGWITTFLDRDATEIAAIMADTNIHTLPVNPNFSGISRIDPASHCRHRGSPASARPDAWWQAEFSRLRQNPHFGGSRDRARAHSRGSGLLPSSRSPSDA